MSRNLTKDNYNLDGIDGFLVGIPEFFLFCAILLLITLNIYYFKSKQFKNSSKFSIFVIFITAILVLFNPYHGFAFNDLVFIDQFNKFMKCLILLSIFFILIMTKNKSEIEGINYPEFNVLVLLSTCGMMIAASSNSLMTLYLAIELQSLPIYVLCALRKNNLKSSESGLKYFVLGALSSGFLLFGISLIYGFAGSVNYNDINLNDISSNLGLNFGLVFLISGIAFKISAAPFHMWAPDVYEGSPSPITLLIASAPKITAITVLMILTFKVFKKINYHWDDLLIVLCITSMIVGSIGAIIQSNIKRLLAYSSIAHIGFILLGLVSFSKSGLSAVMLYLIIYLFLLIGVFSIILSLKKEDQPIEALSDLKGLSVNFPHLSISLLIFMFSMAGIPPLSGFFGKWFVFFAVVEKGFYSLAVIGVIFSVISAFYYLKIIKIMYFEGSEDQVVLDQTLELKFSMYLSLIITCFIFLFLPFFQGLITKSLL